MLVMDATGTVMALSPIHVNEIPDEGSTLSLDVEPEEIGLTASDARFRGPLNVTAEVERVEETVSVAGLIEGTQLLECVRCLSPFESELSLSFSAEYRAEAPAKKAVPAVEQTAEAEEEKDLGPEEDDEIYRYRKDEVELAEMLREQIILAVPMHPLCEESCQGLCPVCGQNRNVKQCGCQEARPESPFAVLKRKLSEGGA